ncbi:MAG: cation transporter [Trueperella sp.]|nr:cation transporter [Trueperella sp.]
MANNSAITAEVSGMSCQNCVNHVTTALLELANVSAVEVDLNGGLVHITTTGEVTDAELRATIDEAGYDVHTITR